jgi:transglutaminase-like putative cysteine protease
LGHVDLANYTVTRLINWKLDRAMYCDYVLSPLIDDTSHLELSWRKQMWKTFWPRVRHENTPQAAAQIVVRCLRERVTIAPDFRKQTGIESVWSTKIANSDDFETVYVAALRSVGIAARLAEDHRAEFWSNNGWSAAPRPPLVTLLRSPAAVDGIASADLERPK